jgi:hypothetical protein
LNGILTSLPQYQNDTAHPTKESIAFVEEHDIKFEGEPSLSNWRVGINRRETPFVAESIRG